MRSSLQTQTQSTNNKNYFEKSQNNINNVNYLNYNKNNINTSVTTVSNLNNNIFYNNATEKSQDIKFKSYNIDSYIESKKKNHIVSKEISPIKLEAKKSIISIGSQRDLFEENKKLIPNIKKENIITNSNVNANIIFERIISKNNPNNDAFMNVIKNKENILETNINNKNIKSQNDVKKNIINNSSIANNKIPTNDSNSSKKKKKSDRDENSPDIGKNLEQSPEEEEFPNYKLDNIKEFFEDPEIKFVREEHEKELKKAEEENKKKAIIEQIKLEIQKNEARLRVKELDGRKITFDCYGNVVNIKNVNHEKLNIEFLQPK